MTLSLRGSSAPFSGTSDKRFPAYPPLVYKKHNAMSREKIQILSPFALAKDIQPSIYVLTATNATAFSRLNPVLK